MRGIQQFIQDEFFNIFRSLELNKITELCLRSDRMER